MRLIIAMERASWPLVWLLRRRLSWSGDASDLTRDGCLSLFYFSRHSSSSSYSSSLYFLSFAGCLGEGLVMAMGGVV